MPMIKVILQRLSVSCENTEGMFLISIQVNTLITGKNKSCHQNEDATALLNSERLLNNR